MRARVCSATATALAPGVFITAIPALVAASRSMLSTPTPARPITRSLSAPRNVSGVTFTAERTISASASERRAARFPFTCSWVITVQSCSAFRSWTALEATFSAITIFIGASSGDDCVGFGKGLRIRKLGCGYTCAEFYFGSGFCQYMFQRADNRDGVQVVVEAEVGNPEQLAFHLSLAVGDHGSKAVAEGFYDQARVDSARRSNRG